MHVKLWGLILVAPLAMAVQHIASSSTLGTAEGRCRANETGPAFRVTVEGLRDRRGRLKLEVYPSNETDFLEDDNVLVMAGKTFRRVEVPVPRSGNPVLCVRIPGSGDYSLSVLHDRDSNRRFGLSTDGVGFSANPRIRRRQPNAAETRIRAGMGITPARIVMNYRTGLFSFGPLGD